MRTVLAFVTVLSVTAAATSIADFGTAVSARRHQLMLSESSLPSPGARDTALAEAESNGPTRFSRDTAQMAEASQPSPGARDTAV